jgi:hypothetical protein
MPGMGIACGGCKDGSHILTMPQLRVILAAYAAGELHTVGKGQLVHALCVLTALEGSPASAVSRGVAPRPRARSNSR